MFMFSNQCIKDQYSGRNARHNSMIQKAPFTKKTVGFGINRIKISKPRVQGKKKNMFYILKVMSYSEVPKEDFPPQSPGYKPADGQSHSAELRETSLSSQLTPDISHWFYWWGPGQPWPNPINHTKNNSCQIFESPEELRPGKFDFRGSRLWLKLDILTTNTLNHF